MPEVEGQGDEVVPMEASYHRAEPMRLFANWEMDRASTSAVQRVFTLNLSRFYLSPIPAQLRGFVITAKLEGYKRSLRSNEIVIPESSTTSADIPLDISFTIQYPHFLKHKHNMMQIHIQRKRKYKNRPIPGGFKSVAIGAIDLTSMLQAGSGQRGEILLFSYQASKQDAHNPQQLQSIGRISMSSCATLPLDAEIDGRSVPLLVKTKLELSEDSEISEDEDSDLPNENGHHSGRSDGRPGSGAVRGGQLRDSQRRRKREQTNKNIKQRLRTLLKKFKVPDEGGVEAAASLGGREPTEKELQELWDELEELSDSGNEGIAADDVVSIVSNPRPFLRPYFTSSREQIPLPSIHDDRGSESEAEDAEWSSETEGVPPGAVPPFDTTTNTQTPLNTSGWRERSSTCGGGSSMAHSQTAGSLAARDKDRVARNASLSDQLLTMIDGPSTSKNAPECIWLCQTGDDSLISSLATASSIDKHEKGPAGRPLHLVATNSFRDVRVAIQQIVGNIQNFCNSNSTSPPVTWVGILGPDRLVSQVLSAYVDALKHKSSTSWLQYLRFAVVVPPSSLVGRLMAGLDPALEALSRDVWERWGELSAAERRGVAEKMSAWPPPPKTHGHSGAMSLVNLPIGEALLFYANDKITTEGSDRVFVPFLVEMRVGEEEEGGCPSVTCSPRPFVPADAESPSNTSGLYVSVPGQSSPPASPHTKGSSSGESREMLVEYWIGSTQSDNVLAPLQPGQHPTTPQGKKDKDSGRNQVKSHFRTVVVTRHSLGSLLSLSFLKEKKKEKMLLKLGMKNKLKSEAESSPHQITNIGRLTVSAHGKHPQMSVLVDGCPYAGIRYFQSSSQWQTYVKHFPIGLLTPGLSSF